MKKRIFIFLALLIFVASMVYAAGSYSVDTFAGPGGSIQPAGDFYPAGSAVEITITPDNGYYCVMYTINGKSYPAGDPGVIQFSVSVNRNITVSAFFEPN